MDNCNLDTFEVVGKEQIDVCECGDSVYCHSTQTGDEEVVFHGCAMCECEGFWRQ